MQGNRSTYSSFFLKLTSITLQTVMPQPERHFCLYRVIGADFCFFISGCTLRKHLLSLSHASKAFLPSGGSSLFYAKMFYSTLLQVIFGTRDLFVKDYVVINVLSFIYYSCTSQVLLRCKKIRLLLGATHPLNIFSECIRTQGLQRE